MFPAPYHAYDHVFEFRVPRIKFGIGTYDELPYDLKWFRARRVFIVTYKFFVEKMGLIERTRRLLGSEFELGYWDEVEPEPSDESIDRCAEAIKKFNPDVVVAVGGGSAMDTAKLALAVAMYGGRTRDYVAKPYGGGKPIPGPLKPLICVPTTAGTGSEVTSVAVVKLPDKHVKVGVSSEYLRPALAILDPEFTRTAPPKVTRDTGFDALTHAVEAYLARPYYTRPKPADPSRRPVYVGANPVTDVLAERAIELIGKYLRRAVYMGETDMEARAGMLLASNLAGMAFGNAGTSIAHAAAYPLGGRYKVTHGEAVGILLPAVLEFIAPADYCKATRVGELLTGEKPPCRCCPEGAKWAAQKIRELARDVKFTNGLEAVGVREEDIPEMARETMNQTRLLALSPRPVTPEDIEWIYRRSWRLY